MIILKFNLEINSNIRKGKNNYRFYRNLMKSNKKLFEYKYYISIIIPCYNVENYIDRCMQSIVAQTIGFDNLQVIFINDASTDNTIKKLENWESKFPENVIVVDYDENLRQGGARNIGLCYAAAEYVGFIDADDWIEADMYESLYKTTKEKKWNVIKGKYIRYYSEQDKQKPAPNSDYSVIRYEFENKGRFYKGETSDVGNKGFFGCVCSGIFYKELILKNNIWFPEKLAYEDDYWQSLLNLYVENICIIDKPFYYWFFNDNSTVASMNAAHHFDRITIEMMLIDEYKRRNAFNIFYTQIEYEFIDRIYFRTLESVFVRFNYIPSFFDILKKAIFLYFPDLKNELDFSRFNILQQKLLNLLYTTEHITVETLENVKSMYLELVYKN